MAKLSIEYRPIGDLKPRPTNPRTHSKKQIEQIAASIHRFGFTNPVLISDDNEIIAGHGRVLAAKELGIAAVPTLRLSHLGLAERRRYARRQQAGPSVPAGTARPLRRRRSSTSSST